MEVTKKENHLITAWLSLSCKENETISTSLHFSINDFARASLKSRIYR